MSLKSDVLRLKTATSLSYLAIASQLNCSVSYVRKVCQEDDKAKGKEKRQGERNPRELATLPPLPSEGGAFPF